MSKPVLTMADTAREIDKRQRAMRATDDAWVTCADGATVHVWKAGDPEALAYLVMAHGGFSPEGGA